MVQIRLFSTIKNKACLLVLGSWLVVQGSFFLTPQVFAQKIYMFCEGDYHDEVAGNDVEGAITSVREVLNMNMPSEYLVHYNGQNVDDFSNEWTGPDIRSSENVYDDILDAIESCPAGKDDTIFFYWTGHGAHDDQGHYLFMPEGKGRPTMHRSEILEALKAKHSRLVVFVTDSCNTYMRIGSMPAFGPGSRNQRLITDGVPILYANLFFEYEGVLDLNSSSRNQKAMIYSGQSEGTVFSCSIFDILENKRLESYDWKTFVQQIDSSPLINSYGQKSQVLEWPKKLSSYSISDSAITRNGTWKIDVMGKDWQLYTTYEPYRRRREGWPPIGGGSGHYMPERGDRIVGVNGVPVHNTAEFSREVKSSPTEITLRVYETRKGGYCYLQTNLLPPGSRSRLGILVDDDYGPGVVVLEAWSGYPGTSCEYIPDDGSGSWGTDIGWNPGGGDTGSTGGWTGRRYMPEIGDRIIEVNGEPVNSEAEYRRAVKNSPTTITLTIIELRNQKRAYLRTELLPSNRRTRLGINAITSDLGGVVVNYVVPGSPGMRCQYKSE